MSNVNKMFEQDFKIAPEYPNEFDVYLVGDSKVGKTSLASKYFSNSFDESYNKTLEETFPKGKKNINGKELEIFMWNRDGSD